MCKYVTNAFTCCITLRTVVHAYLLSSQLQRAEVAIAVATVAMVVTVVVVVVQ
jgi:hypothetical protein